jgi:hypothetical protein
LAVLVIITPRQPPPHSWCPSRQLGRSLSRLYSYNHFDLLYTAAGRERHAKVIHHLTLVASLAGSPFHIVDDFLDLWHFWTSKWCDLRSDDVLNLWFRTTAWGKTQAWGFNSSATCDFMFAVTSILKISVT